MVKNIPLFLFSILLSVQAYSQQRAQFSQYMNNFYLINPAAGGTEDYTDVKASFRSQWLGMKDAPVTYYLSAHAPIGKVAPKSSRAKVSTQSHHSVGGLVYRDITGPISKLALSGSYSYNMHLSDGIRASAGAFLGLQQYTVNGSMLRYHDPGDNTTIQRATVPDLGLGIWVYSKKVFLGISSSQVFQNKLNFDYLDTNSVKRSSYGKLNNHYFLTGGVSLDVTDQIKIIPSALIKIVTPLKPAIDLNLKVKYEDLFWIGASYRNKDSFIALFGVSIKSIADISYSYDATISGLSKYGSGSHEILLGLRLKGNRKQSTTSNFW